MIAITLGNGISFYIDEHDNIGFEIAGKAWADMAGNKASLGQKATKENIDKLLENIQRLRIHGTDH